MLEMEKAASGQAPARPLESSPYLSVGLFLSSLIARWSLAGAEAVLRLRALVTNGDFDEYWRFHLQQARERNHRSRYANGTVPNPLPGLRSARSRLRRIKWSGA